MITDDDVLRLFERADPARVADTAPDVDGVGYLATLRTRSSNVTLIDTEPTPTQPDTRHRRVIITLAAAAVVAILVGALVYAGRGDSNEPQIPAATTTGGETSATAAAEIARGFIDAYAANDADQALTYLTDDVIATGGLGRLGFDVVDDPESAEDFRRTLAWNEATGYKLTVKGCERSDGGTGTDITLQCDYDVHVLGSDAIGLGPFPESWELTVRGDKIVASSYLGNPGGEVCDTCGIYQEVWEPFAGWINTEHPDDAPIMYAGSEQNLYNRATTDEALLLWEQRTAEFVQAVLTGREAYPADVAAICATQAAELVQLTVPAEGALDQVAAWSTAAAAILQQTVGELSALDKPVLTDTMAYSQLQGRLVRLVRNLEAAAEAAAAGDATRLAALDAEYLDVREGMSSGPAGSGLEECLANLPS